MGLLLYEEFYIHYTILSFTYSRKHTFYFVFLSQGTPSVYFPRLDHLKLVYLRFCMWVPDAERCCIQAFVLRVMSKLFLLQLLNLPLGFQINHKKYEKALVAQI